jgi:hypothetical protein
MSASDHLNAVEFPYGSVVHRGVSLAMPPERAARFHAAGTPAEKASVVMEHLNASNENGNNNRLGWGGNAGQHWTNSASVARGFSTQHSTPAHAKQMGELGLPRDVGVILHAQPPTEAQRFSPRGQRNFGANYPSEDEVTYKGSAPVKLTGMSFPDDRPEVWGKPSERQPDTYAPASARLRAGKSWT